MWNKEMEMSDDPVRTSSRLGERALEHARVLARQGRGSATPAEAEAARYVQGQLVQLGIADVRQQPFRGLRSLWLFLSLAFGLALVGHAAIWMLSAPLGKWEALAISLIAFGMSGYLLYCKFTFRSYPLQEMLPHGPSQNVIAVIPPRGEVRQRVVLVSHLDSHRAVVWYAHDWLVRAYGLVAPLVVWGVAAAPLLYMLRVVTGWDVFGWLGLALGGLHFLGWFSGVTADLGPYSPGANDNAAAVGTVLALAERLKGEPLEHTEVRLAFTGCEETGCDGMLAFLREQGEMLKDALLIDLELPGIGERAVYLPVEGMVRRRRIPAEVERLVRQAGDAFGLQAAPGSAAGYFTEAGAAWEHGFKAVCLVALPQGSNLMPEWHRMTDRPERLQSEALERMGELVWAVLGILDRGG
jgi:hypothetical protein